jgi:PPE-repeat protein
MDWAVLPPEINSARITAGPGSAPLMAAATAWMSLSAELNAATAGWQSVISTVLSVWRGPSSAAMLGAASSHIAWLAHAAAHAELTAGQAQLAAAAYETARAAMVPLPMVTANRMQLMVLVATNLLGQNTAAIAANEAQYAAMWAQDVAVMGAYQGASLAATSGLPTLSPAQPGGTPSAAAAAPAAATGGIGSIISDFLGGSPGTFLGTTFQSFLSSGSAFDFVPALLGLLPLFGISSGVGSIANEIHTGLHVAAPIIPAMPGAAGAPTVRVRVGIGRPLGGLGMSVPPSWAGAAQPAAVERAPIVRPLAAGQAFVPAPIPTAIAARQSPQSKSRGQSVEESELLKTARFTYPTQPG